MSCRPNLANPLDYAHLTVADRTRQRAEVIDVIGQLLDYPAATFLPDEIFDKLTNRLEQLIADQFEAL